MTDDRLRRLERGTAAGDELVRETLIQHRVRVGLCPWCGGAGAVHGFEDADGVSFDAACCCGTCFGMYSRKGMCGECPGAKKGEKQCLPETT